MAARANVNFYTIDPRGLVGMTNEFMEMAGNGAPELAGGAGHAHAHRRADHRPHRRHVQRTVRTMNELMLSQDSLRELAEQTGGIAAVNTNSLTRCLRAASWRPTAGITCSATTRRPIRATAGSTRLT